MKVYHYSRLSDWQGIEEGSYKSDHVPGLAPTMPLVALHPEGSTQFVSFGLLDPLPPEWISNPIYPHIWEKFRANVGLLLLELEADSKDLFVVDWGHREGVLTLNPDKVPLRYRHSSEKEAEDAYIASKIPIDEFLRNRDKLAYTLPEVIIFSHIPFDDIKVPEKQPMLEDYLRRYGEGRLRRRILQNVSDIPPLEPWLHTYIGSHPEIRL